MRRKLKCECFTPNGRYKDKNGEVDVTAGEGRNWLFSRYSTGWRCGLHADWTELTGCVDNYLSGLEPEVRERRYFYITFLRYKELVLLDKILSLTLSGTRCRGT